MTAIDPAIVWTLRSLLALLFADAAWRKLADPAAFTAAVRAYELAPARAARPLAILLLLGEVAAAAGLLIPGHEWGGALGAALLALYAAAIAVNLGRGRRDLDCGCGGPGMRRPVSNALMVRNLVLAGAALVVLVPESERALGWIDLATVLAATATLAALWTAVARLDANRPALARVRGVA